MPMNAAPKITLPPLDFQEFNTLDVTVNGEIQSLTYDLYRIDIGHASDPVIAEGKRRMLAALRKLRSRIDSVRPPNYAEVIRAARAESVCDT